MMRTYGSCDTGKRRYRDELTALVALACCQAGDGTATSVRATAARSARGGISPRIPGAAQWHCERVMDHGHDALDQALYVATILDEEDDVPRRHVARPPAVSPAERIVSPLVALLVLVVLGSLLLAVWPYAHAGALVIVAVATLHRLQRVGAASRRAAPRPQRHPTVSGRRR